MDPLENHVSAISCQHHHHLFKSPLCSKLTTQQKVGNVFLHIFTFALPLLGYKINGAIKRSKLKATNPLENNSPSLRHSIDSVSSEINSSPKDRTKSLPIKKNSSPAVHPHPNYSTFGQETIDAVLKSLPPEMEHFQFSAGWCGISGTHQPINQDIARLSTFYWNVCFKNFEDALKNSPADPWDQPSVIDAADQLMRVGFAISCLTLDDLDAFVQNLESKGITRTKEKALTEQDSYMYRTFYYCTNAYHWIRGGIAWKPDPFQPDQMGLFFPHTISNDQTKQFYKKGTIQHDWNNLYNEYCDRIKLYVKLKTLEIEDGRHVNWTVKDKNPKKFYHTPDTQPT